MLKQLNPGENKLLTFDRNELSLLQTLANKDTNSIEVLMYNQLPLLTVDKFPF